MALVSLFCFPSTTHISTEHIQNPHRQSHHSINNLSLSQPPHSRNFPRLSLEHSPNVRTKQSINFTLGFASTSQEQVLHSSPSDVPPDGQETEAPTEEFSRTRLIAQNVPWTCTTEDIRSLFERHGKVLDVELSMYNKTRNKGLAFVEMGAPEDAIAAINNLESYEFEGRKINVEYARPKKKKIPPPVKPKPAGTYNLFVANLSYKANSEDLMEFFNSGSEGVVSAEVIFYDNTRKPAGFGFVYFESKQEAEAALSEFQGKIFMGRPIRVAWDKQFVNEAVEESASSGETSSTLSVTDKAE
ncbi:28 kDa ribonucleoprotein, chloroplastic-like [Gastrolobium bilobum]|uniref:28 kDa ribonucleoprotein, chloroplastic-like n=1 Tax=Gastrolobium bilobum TaxID=150636 RepID=UPI002AB286D5|nr:28 kDa ribonucleoprotein, chloroplastic-like [Gastrolobium bilobum]